MPRRVRLVVGGLELVLDADNDDGFGTDFDADDLWKRSVIAAGEPGLFTAWRDWIRARR